MSPPPHRDAELQAEPNVWSPAVGTGPDRRGLELPTGITPADAVRATANSLGVPPVVLSLMQFVTLVISDISLNTTIGTS